MFFLQNVTLLLQIATVDAKCIAYYKMCWYNHINKQIQQSLFKEIVILYSVEYLNEEIS